MWQVDAFTDRLFSGNPAAVCLLDGPRDAAWMQSVAAEMNLSETAFVRRLDGAFELRWFTPAVEVDLCGHATLAAAFVLWRIGAAPAEQPIQFHTRSGVLTARHDQELIQLDFPATPPAACAAPAEFAIEPEFVGKTVFDRFVVVGGAHVVRALSPDFRRLAAVAGRGVIVTAVADDPRFDFISRFFAPAVGVAEDPVTGSAHCALAPYWSQRLGKTSMTAYQASARGGFVHVRLNENRVILGGQAVLVLQGELA
jgi:predicted PhzF superfamily epimerase YddE/YHI9